MGRYLFGGGITPETITFNIEGVYYTIDSGTTWKEFIDTDPVFEDPEYNSFGYDDTGAYISITSDITYIRFTSGGDIVQSTDVIQANDYKLE